MKKIPLISLILLLLSGCTLLLWKQDNYREEYLEGFYINKEAHVLLASTEKQGFVFPISKNEEEILSLSRTYTYQPAFNNFGITSSREVTGTLKLTLAEKGLTEEDIIKLKALGFKQVGRKNKKLFYATQLKGKQYDIDGELPLVKLENKYRITVKQPASFITTAGKIIATPVTIAFDMFLGGPGAFFVVALLASSN